MLFFGKKVYTLLVLVLVIFTSEYGSCDNMSISSGSIYFINPAELDSIKIAATSGSKEAAIRLYHYYSFSMMNETESEHWLKVAADLGDPVSQYNLAQFYLREEDSKNALIWAKLSLTNGVEESKEIIDEIEGR